MKEVTEDEIIAKIVATNPWWRDRSKVPFTGFRARRYFYQFLGLAKSRTPNRALILMGPRRVGKTVVVFHFIKQAIDDGTEPSHLTYLDLQQPLYNGLSLEKLVELSLRASRVSTNEQITICFDEIQYLKQWEVHLKILVDNNAHIKFIATGSAAAALKLKSQESGAGRFTEFLLPPLTFYEFLDLLEESDLVKVKDDGLKQLVFAEDITRLNELFVDYLNYGGYPEAIFSEEVKSDPSRYIRSDIIDKVLLKDLPSLYGIQDIQELNSLFTNLAYNTANELSLGDLSQKSGVAKNTLKKYIEYLESAFLIRIVHRLDHNSKRFQRATNFKVYLTNPTMRCALFSPVAADSQEMGALVETAVFSQWFHSMYAELHYCRWHNGEVDIVNLNNLQKPIWAVEVKWSDQYEEHPSKLESLKEFCTRNPSCSIRVTTKTKQSSKELFGTNIQFIPASVYCYILGLNIIRGKERFFEFFPRDTSLE
jgi:uncharacterized protein